MPLGDHVVHQLLSRIGVQVESWHRDYLAANGVKTLPPYDPSRWFFWLDRTGDDKPQEEDDDEANRRLTLKLMGVG